MTYSEIKKGELAFSRRLTHSYWSSKYDAPKMHCPSCGSFQESSELTIAHILEDVDDKSTEQKQCDDCGTTYYRVWSV